jgi:hypothetical protein
MYCSRQHMPIIQVWKIQGGNKMLKILHKAIMHMSIHHVAGLLQGFPPKFRAIP